MKRIIELIFSQRVKSFFKEYGKDTAIFLGSFLITLAACFLVSGCGIGKINF